MPCGYKKIPDFSFFIKFENKTLTMKHLILLKLQIILTAVVLCFPVIISAQTINKEKSYGGVRDDIAFTIKECPDGNYALFGWTKSFGKGNANEADFYFLKINTNGDSIIARTYHRGASESGISMDNTSDGGFIMCGNYSYYTGRNYFLLYKIKSNLDTSWSKIFKSPWRKADHMCTSIKQTPDKGFVVTGYCNGYDTTNNNIWLIKTDSNGDSLWSRHYGGVFNEEAWSVINTNDGGFAILGTTYSYGQNSGNYSDVYLVRTNSAGDTLWTRNYGGANNDFGSEIYETADHGFIIAATTFSYGKGMCDIWLIKTDSNGDTLWTGIYGTTAVDQGRFVRPYKGGYMIGGVSYGTGTASSDGYMVFTDANGKLLKTITSGGLNLDELWGAEITHDNLLLVAGNTQSWGHGFNEMYFLKIAEGTGIMGNTLQRKTALTYPNPAKNEIRITFNEIPDNQLVINIYNLAGIKVATYREKPAKNLVLPLKGLNGGQYLYTIEDGSGKIMSGKLSIQ